MFRYFDVLINTRGDALRGYRLRLIDSNENIVPLFADNNGTPMEALSGIANTAVTDNSGNYFFWVEPGVYDLQILTPSGDLFRTEPSVSVQTGPAGPPGPQGPPGPAGTAEGNVFYVDAQRLEGDTSDDPAFRRAVALASAVGGMVYFRLGEGSATESTGSPWALAQPGDYLMGTNGQNFDPDEAGNLLGNCTIAFDKGVRLIQDETKPYIFFGNPVGIGTPEEPDEQSDYLVNLTIQGGIFVNDVATLGNSEQEAFIHANAATNLLIEGCEFIGSRGDCVYIGAGDIGGGGQNRRNKNVTIRRIRANGINGNNRNPISVIDCDGIIVDDIETINYAKPGGIAPFDPLDPESGFGAPSCVIDFEPNVSFTPDPIMRNAKVTNIRARNGGGGGVAILLGGTADNSSRPNPMRDFTISGFYFNDVQLGMCSVTVDEIIPEGTNIRFEDGVVEECPLSFDITRGRGIYVAPTVTFRRNVLPGRITLLGGQTTKDVEFYGLFDECGEDSGVSMQVRGLEGGVLAPTFRNCSGRAFQFLNTNIVKNVVFNPRVVDDNSSANVLSLLYSADDFEVGQPVIESFSCIEEGDAGALVSSFRFAVNKSIVSRVPILGAWRKGNTLRIKPGLEPGSPRGWYCIADTNEGTRPSFVIEGQIPGFAADVAATTSAKPPSDGGTDGAWTATSGLIYRNNGRWESTAPTQLLYRSGATPISGGNTASYEFAAPYSGSQDIYAGFSLLSTPTFNGNITLSDLTGVWFDGSIDGAPLARAISQGSLNDPRGSFTYGQQFRVTATSSGTNITVRFYRRNTPAGSWVEQGTAIVIASTVTNIRPMIAFGSAGQSIQIIAASLG